MISNANYLKLTNKLSCLISIEDIIRWCVSTFMRKERWETLWLSISGYTDPLSFLEFYHIINKVYVSNLATGLINHFFFKNKIFVMLLHHWPRAPGFGQCPGWIWPQQTPQQLECDLVQSDLHWHPGLWGIFTDYSIKMTTTSAIHNLIQQN